MTANLGTIIAFFLDNCIFLFLFASFSFFWFMDSSREANRKHDDDKKREDEKTSLMDVNLMVVLLSQLCTKNDDDNENGLEKERRDHHVALAHDARESRARANKRFIKETKLMEKRTHVLHPMAKEFRHYRKM
ncbi:PREDICTED: uncharacterized protein LOC104784679 [Camelina sativa]|uniref:Uncharacterized protein LOC104784679 n=1 Tax=Camelina sativa TaxID=90675 RepID=A0ABM0YYS6_CAMSA|nr:PREDICTED: uncharacterized protein LOC104784679 [Camelina sativa]